MSHVQLARDFFASQDRRHGGPDPALCTTDYQAWLGGWPPMPWDGHEQFALAFYQGFPDIHHTVDDVFAADDRVAVRFVLNGTHTGSFMGIVPSGRSVSVVTNVLMRIVDGKVAELHGIFDEAGLLRQIGVLQG